MTGTPEVLRVERSTGQNPLGERAWELNVAPLCRRFHTCQPTLMTPHEKAANALNARLERLQANLRDAHVESARRFLVQSIVVVLGIGEALNDYGRAVARYAQRRHAILKQTNEALAAQHEELLSSGKERLERFKAAPTDKALRKELEATQQKMASIQKTLRRAANTLQRDLAPGLAVLDELAVSVRKFGEAEQAESLQRVLQTVIGLARKLYAAQPDLPGKNLIDATAWEKSALGELDQAVDFYDAYARTGHQLLVAIELMAIALSETPPQTAEETAQRANDGVAARVKAITARFAGG